MEKPGQRIRTLRLAKGWNQTELAEKADVDQSTISDIESKGSDFKVSVLLRLSNALGASEAMILKGEDSATWPFKHVSLASFLALSTEDRARIEGRLEEAIAGIAAAAPPKPQTVLLSGTKQAKKRKAA